MSQVGNDWILSAASLCFPSRWDVREKIGKNLLGIHGPVPHYAETIGSATQNIFDKFLKLPIMALMGNGLFALITMNNGITFSYMTRTKYIL
jgi:hypothetical protein